jgi:para-nitrobenzyl esterase
VTASSLLRGIIGFVVAFSAQAAVVEYFDPDLDNYFITADPTEQAFVDTGAVGRWLRTGNDFLSGGPNQVCRFYGNSAINPATGKIYGPNSHFYTADPTECAGLKAQFNATAGSWKFESNDFLTTPPVAGGCAGGLTRVYRAYNNGFAKGIDSNHRITTNFAAYQQTVASGWTGEGVVMCAPSAPQVVTESGPVTGLATGQMNEYLGIPYAAPPVGGLRWMPPRPFGTWSGVFRATQFGSECPQENGGKENCLFLNVYAPAAQTDGKFAVMVWIHGGGLTQGAGSEYDPTPLVAGGGVIVVTVNYRLALLGFFAHPALDGEGHLAGNYGLMDQQYALGWVKRNIAAFGGDSNRVTVFGESAGGLSVYSQLASPLAAGLFQRAIAQSGAYASFADYLDRIIPIAAAETTGNPGVGSGIAIAGAAGCASQSAACLRGVPARTLVDLNSRTTYPFIDGTLLNQTLLAAFSSGQFNQVPVITGTTHDEYRYLVANNFNLNPGVGPLANADYVSAINALYYSLTPTQRNTVLANYPLPTNPPANAASLALGTAGTDGTFVCPARHATQALAGHVTTYAYEFNDENAPPPIEFPQLPFPLGAYHSADVQYLFNRSGIPSLFTADQKQLSRAMIVYWTQFAKTGDPNSTGQPVWAPYNSSTDQRLSFIPPIPTAESTFAADHKCALWGLF